MRADVGERGDDDGVALLTSWQPSHGGAESTAGVAESLGGLETNLHWQFGREFSREDASRVENRHGARNLAVIRKLRLGLLHNTRARHAFPKTKRAASRPVVFWPNSGRSQQGS